MLVGPGAGSTLTGENKTSTWTLLGGTSGSYNDGSLFNLTFSQFATLQGGDAGDTFTVSANAVNATANLSGGTSGATFSINSTLSGTVTGTAGTNTLEGTQIVNVTLSGSSAVGYGGSATGTSGASLSGFSNIDVLVGTNAGTITGEDVSSTWLLGASETYYDVLYSVLPVTSTHYVTFSQFATLQGGDAGNWFYVESPTTATLKGGAGNDTFQVDAILTGLVDGQAGTNALLGSEIYNVTLTGSSTYGSDGTVTDAGGKTSITHGFLNIGTVSNNGDLTFDTLLSTNTSFSFASTTGNIYFGDTGSLVAAGTVSLSAPNGIIDVENNIVPGTTNVVATGAVLTALNGIGDTNPLTTAVSTFDFDNIGSGPVNVNDTMARGLTIAGANAAGSVNVTELAGNLAVGTYTLPIAPPWWGSAAGAAMSTCRQTPGPSMRQGDRSTLPAPGASLRPRASPWATTPTRWEPSGQQHRQRECVARGQCRRAHVGEREQCRASGRRGDR